LHPSSGASLAGSPAALFVWSSVDDARAEALAQGRPEFRIGAARNRDGEAHDGFIFGPF